MRTVEKTATILLTVPESPMHIALRHAALGLSTLTLPAPIAAQQAARPAAQSGALVNRDAALIRPTPEALTRRLTAARAATVARQGGESVTAQAARLRSERASIASLRSRPVQLPGAAGGPSIRTVNNKTSGAFEPGGGYQIVGRGFGNFTRALGDRPHDTYRTYGFTVALVNRATGQSALLSLQSWTDQVIYAELPDDITRWPDIDRAALVIRSPHVTVESEAFGFRAKRREVTLTNIPREAFQPDHITSTTGYRADDGKPQASRWTETDNRDIPCFSPGKDRYRLNAIPLKPGFWINRVDFRFEPPRNGIWNSPLTEWRDTGFGSYAARFEGDDLVIDWGVQRRRSAHRTGTGKAVCESAYGLTFFAVGPEGMPAQ